MDKKKLFLWCLYDFANSIVFVNFLVYFSKWLVIDGALPDIAYNSVFVLTAILLLFSAPALAARTDANGGRKLYLNISTIGTIVSYGAAALIAQGGAVWAALAAFLSGQFFYQMSFMFFDPMINDISDAKHRARASGMGQFCNSAGMIFGLAMSLPLAEIGRLAPLLPAVVLFAALALPMMVFYKEKNIRRPARAVIPTKVGTHCAAGNKNAVRQWAPADDPMRVRRGDESSRIRLGFDFTRFKKFMATSPAAMILVAFFFYNDALTTITNNYSIYAGAVVGMDDANTSILLMLVQIMAAFGALAVGFVGDRIGARRTLLGILWIWLILIPVLAAASAPAIFVALAAVLGFTIGAGWAASRAYISLNLEKGSVGYGFSFYTIFERFSSMAGPLVWGGILAAGFGYRAAMFSMAAFVAAGLFIICKKPKTARSAVISA